MRGGPQGDQSLDLVRVERCDRGWCARSGQQAQDPAAAKVLAQQAFQCRMDVEKRVVEPIGEAGRLVRQVGVVAGQDRELDGGLLLEADPPYRVGQGAGGVSDDVGVARVGLRVAGVEAGSFSSPSPVGRRP